jgi:site-specific DNA-methyltransferase (adenine-specific)
MKSEVFNEDCMAVMARYPDKYFDLACIDPPYGIGEDGKSNHSRGKFAKPTLYTPKNWDKEPPPLEYFYELFRVSKNQVVWGANHFISRMPYDSSCWIIWDKENGENDFADCEMAWASFGTAVRRFKFRWAGMLQGNMKNKETRIHPTQKPVALYDWIFSKYATEGMKVLDTHLGSGSSRIAAHKAGLSFVGCELDKEYYDAQEKRYKDFISQLRLF